APGNEILTADSDAVIRVWNGTTGAYITDLINLQSGGSLNPQTMSVVTRYPLDIAVADNRIAAVCDDDFVRVWTGGGTLLYTTGIGTEPGLYPVSVAIGDVAAASGNEILTADSDAVIRVWNGTTGAYITDLINLQSGGWLNPQTMSVVTRYPLDIAVGAEENKAPIANAGLDQAVGTGVGATTCSANVTLSGSGSSDPDGNALSYAWAWSGGTASGVSPTVILPVGSTTVTLTVSDGSLTATDTVVITITDNTPPVISGLTASPDCLWSPNHKMVDVIVDSNVSDNCGIATTSVTVTGVTSDESTVTARGAGGKGGGASLHVPDAELDPIYSDIVSLRAERSGTGDGRVYEITADVEAADAAGNSTTTTGLKVKVVVPHDEADGCSAVDNGQNYNATEVN
ncbi:MAG: hypothetical protein HY606_09505, partial [Planctomycetes bacterium]|nr:hypothetical protein [Planctomycetota bacterium]